jgi:hypothetical protein
MAPIPRNFRTLSKGLDGVERNARNCPELAVCQIVDSRTFARSGVLWAPIGLRRSRIADHRRAWPAKSTPGHDILSDDRPGPMLAAYSERQEAGRGGLHDLEAKMLLDRCKIVVIVQ